MKNKGVLYVISGPSGVGKGTICKELIKRNPKLSVSVSATTRKPRCEDSEGVTYFFKSEEEFREMIEDNKFLEWAVYNGNYYGTPREAVEKSLENGCDIILEIDVQGALNVKTSFDGGVLIFIAPPNENALYERLRGRGTENEEEISERIGAAKKELELKNKYDYVVINDCVDDAVLEIEKIMKKETSAL